MLTLDEYMEELQSEMDYWKGLMQEAWGEVPIIEPKVTAAIRVETDFDLGDFPHQGQYFTVTENKAEKFSPKKVAKKLITEINSHRNFCNRCGVPVPHIYQRSHGPYKNLLGQMNYKTREKYTQEEADAWDLPPDVLEQKLHPIYTSRLRRRLAYKAKEAEYNPLDAVYNIPKENLRTIKAYEIVKKDYSRQVIPAQTGLTMGAAIPPEIKAVK
jgi:hypothetical protein